MKLAILGLGFLLATIAPLGAVAAQTEIEFPTPVETPAEVQPKTVRIPPQSAIFVTFSATEAIDAGGKQPHPVTLTVTQPVFDVAGNIGIPVGSRIDARLVPLRKEKMARIEAKYLVVGSRIVSIQAQSDRLPSERIVIDSGSDRGCRVGGRVAPDLNGIFGEGNGGDALGGSVAIDCSISVFSRDRVLDRAVFRAGKEYLLVLEEEATFPNFYR
ncbi:MAG: hypothetical protein J7647_02945 [Cyanobacteria bacterium SBLK]|nr:hypothetical protein [Cyanobacteria bacterium SBLK]